MNKLLNKDLIELQNELVIVKNFLNNIDKQPELILTKAFYNNKPYNLIFRVGSSDLHEKQTIMVKMLKKISELKEYDIKYDIHLFPSEIKLILNNIDILHFNLVSKTYEIVFENDTMQLEIDLLNQRKYLKENEYLINKEEIDKNLEYINKYNDKVNHKEINEYVCFVYHYYIQYPTKNIFQKLKVKNSILKELPNLLYKIKKNYETQIYSYDYILENINKLENNIKKRENCKEEIEIKTNQLISFFKKHNYLLHE